MCIRDSRRIVCLLRLRPHALRFSPRGIRSPDAKIAPFPPREAALAGLKTLWVFNLPLGTSKARKDFGPLALSFEVFDSLGLSKMSSGQAGGRGSEAARPCQFPLRPCGSPGAETAGRRSCRSSRSSIPVGFGRFGSSVDFRPAAGNEQSAKGLLPSRAQDVDKVNRLAER